MIIKMQIAMASEAVNAPGMFAACASFVIGSD